jgi:GAF domain-containing protein/anti-sigma regulatory factor (Ser/Thr protein kinase)
VPIVRDDAVIGVIALWKERVEPFTLAQVQLVATFSSQAAVAIENARLFQELQAKNDALTAALEQQTATAEILRVISSSPTDLAPVFEAILESALRLCEGNVAALWQFDGAHLHFAKGKGGSTEGVAYLQQHPLPLGNYNPTPQAGLERRPVHVLDVFADARYRPLIAPDTFGTVPNSGTVLAVPLLRGAELLGVITIWRHRKRLFSDRQVAMVTTFADQAVIAIENVRLFNELQLRNRELTESLEQQTATAEILKVISSSPTDVQPVFDAIVKSGVHLFKGVAVSLRLVKGDRIERGAFATGPGCDVSDDMTKPPFPLDDRNFSGRAILRRAVVHVPDVFAEDWVGEEVRKVAARMGWRAIAAAPMLRENKALGAMNVVRARAAPFTEKEIALLRTFADQAVIAIENVRLFKETKDALERQTATAEILKVISSSPTDIQPVLDAVAERAGKLCDAPYANVMLVEGDQLRVMSVYSTEAGPAPDQRNFVPIRRSYVNARAVLEREVVHVPDIIPLMDSEFPDVRRNQQKFGFRAMLVVPLMREGRAVGTIFLWRREPGPFSSDQVALLKTFADQAVIAIENVRLFNETKEALDYQRASAEVLQVISSSVADTQPVFEKVLDSCERLFAGRNVGVNVVGEDGLIRVAAYRGPHREVLLRHFPLPLTEESGSGAAILQRRVVHYSDVEADGVPDHARRGSQLVGNRSVIFAPMLWDGRGIGAIFVGRPTVGEFSEKEITLLKTFADQAVIAIQNARLFNETKEALEKQTAISEILRVISASPTDVQPVFDAIVRSAVTLCGSKDGAVFRYDGERLHYAAGFDQTPEWVDAVRSHYPMRPEASTIAGRAILGLSVVQIDDVLADPAYDHERAVKGGWRRMLAVPMLREGVPLGVIVVSWPQPGPTPKSQEDLLKTFADQAVIAIENVRLFNETKEALDHQKASAEVLQVISSSVSDTEPVFGKILESCERLFASSRVGVNLIGPDGLVHAGAYGNSPGAEKLRNENYPHPVAGSATGAAIIAGRVVHYPDVFGDPDVPPYARRGAEKAGFRSFIMAPLLSEGRGLGAIFVGRETVGPFSEKEIALLKTFADQAVIAIENVRLFNETKEALDQQKASAEVLQVISSSVADAQPVFDKILESCERLFEGRNVGITLVGDDGAVHLGPYRGPDRQELERMYPLPLSTASGSGSAILARRVMHYPDAEGGADVPEPVRRGSRVIGSKSIIFSPMLWEGRGIGAIFVARQAVGEFSEKEIALLKTFADQAVIAIQNAKLFREIQEKSHQLEIADQHKSAFLANMSHELRTPLNAVIGFSEMLAARYFGALTDKQAEYVNDIHGSGKHLLSLINDILDLSKIEAGRMELETAEFDLRTALDNALTLVRERAQRGGVALRLETDPALRTVDGDERKLKQVVLNLLSNAVKFTPRGGTVSVAAKRVDGVAEIAVSDTGVGIAPADQEAIFEAFRQVGTDATRKREGTGLGLALARRFVELHGGTIRVESAPGQGSTFTVTLPLRHGE